MQVEAKHTEIDCRGWALDGLCLEALALITAPLVCNDWRRPRDPAQPPDPDTTSRQQKTSRPSSSPRIGSPSEGVLQTKTAAVKGKAAGPDWRRVEEERLRAEADRLRAEATRLRARRASTASARGAKSKNDAVSASGGAGEPRSYKQVRCSLCFVTSW